MNTAIRRWWYKLKWQCKHGELEECRAFWQRYECLHQVAQHLCTTRLRSPRNKIIRGVEQPAKAITQAPAVWALLDQPSTNEAFEEPPANDALKWLLETCLFDSLASLKLLQTGKTVPLEQDEEQPAHIRLQTLINLTEKKRSNWIVNTDDILPDATFKVLYDNWKDDYESWMNESAQNQWWSVPKKKRHDWTRSRFRNFLFKIVGSYELVVFWLYVKASWSSLDIFKQVFAEEGSGAKKEKAEDKMKRAIRLVRDSA